MAEKYNFVYIAYAQEDRAIAIRVGEHLRAAGIEVWLNVWNIKLGQNWVEQTYLALQTTSCVIALISRHTQNDNYFMDEVNFAVTNDYIVIPLKIDESPWRKIAPARLFFHRYINMYSDSVQGLEILERAVTIEATSYQVKRLQTGMEDSPRTTVRGSYPDASKPVRQVAFTMFSNRKLARFARSALVVYAHQPNEKGAVERDAVKFAPDLGDMPVEHEVRESIEIRHGAQITVVPQCDGIQFEPASLTRIWLGDNWLRFYFDFRLPAEFPDNVANIRVSVKINGLEVAHIDALTEIVAVATLMPDEAKDANPLVLAKLRGNLFHAVTAPYRQIFISYAHKDRRVALRRVGEIERVLGNKVFIDVKNLRAGDDWEAALARAIDEADVFHLLWSQNSAYSKYCRYEWDYALNHKCADNRCVNVIQPVYWHQPMPTPPPELNHLHFEYVNFGLRGFSLSEWFADLVEHVRAVFSLRGKDKS